MSIHKAVIPIAGLGTRLFPASHACKKEFFPIVGPDGIARPLLHYQIMDLLAAGIQDICIIVQPREELAVIDYLSGPGESYLRRLEKYDDLVAEAQKMLSALDHITFAVQETQEGYGHAVYQSREFSDEKPVLLCLGDHLFLGQHESPHQKLIQAYELCGGKTVSAVNRISAEELKGYGTIAGKRTPKNQALIEVSRIIEKPSIAVAAQKLRVDGLNENEFLGWFGMHALSPSIYNVLEDMISSNTRQNGEFQLTFAQELLRQREGYYALEIQDSRRFDFGTPLDYVNSVATYSR